MAILVVPVILPVVLVMLVVVLSIRVVVLVPLVVESVAVVILVSKALFFFADDDSKSLDSIMGERLMSNIYHIKTT